MSYTKTSIQGTFWLGSLKVGVKILTVIKLLIVARILSPRDFGLFGMILLTVSLLETCTELGMFQALIQSTKDISKKFSSVLYIQAIRGWAISIVLWITAPLVSNFFQEDLTLALRIISFAPLMKGLMNPAVILFHKKLDYRKEFIFELSSSAVESISTVIFVIFFPSWYSLIFGVLMGSGALFIFSHLFIKLKITKFKWQNVSDLLGYGKWVTLGSIITFLNDQGDDFVVSKILGPRQLGLYQTAYKISNLATTQGAGMIYQVIFPILTKIQADKARLKKAITKSLLVTTLTSLIIGGGIFVFAPLFTNLVLGLQWQEMIPVLRVLILFGIARPIVSVGLALFDAVGQPNMAAKANFIKLIGLVIIIFPATKMYGIYGAAWAVVVAQLVVLPWLLFGIAKFFRD